jgi:hypothetical protein
VLVPVAGFLGVGIGVSKAGVAGRPEFYRAAISVIPTLLLTLAVQGRFFRLSAFARSPLYEELRHRHITTEHLRSLGFGPPRWALWLFLYSVRRTATPFGTARYALILLLMLAGGEGAAFYVVGVGSPSSFFLGAVAASMAAAFLAIGTLALFGGLPEAAADDPRRVAAQQAWHRVLEELIKRRDDGLRNGTSADEDNV